jgi:hypothetical protein
MMQAIGRIERALARLEQVDFSSSTLSGEPSDLRLQHDKLKREAQSAIVDIDRLLSQIKG